MASLSFLFAGRLPADGRKEAAVNFVCREAAPVQVNGEIVDGTL